MNMSRENANRSTLGFPPVTLNTGEIVNPRFIIFDNRAGFRLHYSMNHMNTTIFITTSPEQTGELGRRLGCLLVAGDVVTLEGDLGCGKTTLTRGICAGLGLPENIPVRSPTFTLIHEYPARIPIRHADLYRMETPEDMETIGLFDEGMEAVTIVEWAERLGVDASSATVKIRITDISETERRIEISAGAEIISRLGNDPNPEK